MATIYGYVGCIVGDLATYYTGKTVEGRHETLQRAIVASDLRTSMVNTLYAEEQDSEALYQLSRLYLHSLGNAYDAMEKMFHGMAKVLLVSNLGREWSINRRCFAGFSVRF